VLLIVVGIDLNGQLRATVDRDEEDCAHGFGEKRGSESFAMQWKWLL